MASVTVRTPMEKFFAANDKNDQRSILTSGVNFVKKFCDDKGIHFAYYVNDRKKEALTNLGVTLHPIPFLTHSHPFCKTLENHLLINVLPNLLGNGHWVFTSVKKAKVNSVIKLAGGVSNNVDIVNRCICAKDFGRYDFEPGSVDQKINILSKDHLFPKNFIRSVRKKKIFIHDEVHHWSHLNMIQFLEETATPLLLCSVVFPPELLGGIKTPQNSALYGFQVDGDKLFFFPDGSRSEMYEQPSNLNWLFEASYIHTSAGTYTVKMVGSFYAHHLFQISKGEKITDSVRFFADFNTIDMSVIHKERFKYYDLIPIKKSHIEKIYTYLLCLKKPDVESAIAKLRQLMEDEQDCRVVEFFCTFAKKLITDTKGAINLFGDSFLQKAKDSFIMALPNSIASCFDRWHGLNIFHFLFTLDTIRVKVETKVVDRGYRTQMFDDLEVKDDVMSTKLPEAIDTLFFGGQLVKGGDRRTVVIKSLDGLIKFSRSKNLYKMHIIFLLNPSLIRGNIRNFCSNGRSLCANDQLESGPLKTSHYKFKLPTFFSKWSEMPFSRSLSYHEIPFLKSFVHFRENNIKRFVDPIFDMIIDEMNQLDLDIMNDGEEAAVEILDVNSNLDGKQSEHHDEEFVTPTGLKGGDGLVTIESIEVDPSEFRTPASELCGLATEPVSFPGDSCSVLMGNEPIAVADEYNICDVEGDGNCFMRALLTSIKGDDRTYPGSRSRLLNLSRQIGVNLTDSEEAQILREGEQFDEWMIMFTVNVMNLSLKIFQGDVSIPRTLSPKLVNTHGNDAKEIAILHRGNHFLGLLKKCTSESGAHDFDGNQPVEASSDNHFDETFETGFNDFEELRKVVGSISMFKKTPLKNRDAFFFSESKSIDYGHNRIKYAHNHWNGVDQLLPSSLRNDYNAMLIQVYKEGGSIGMHRDNEKVYDNDSILSINLNGDALFQIEAKSSKRYSFRMKDGDYFLMKRDFQAKFRHGVQGATEGRINVTFRKHVRNSRNEPIYLGISKFKNICLMRSLSILEKRPLYDILLALIKKNKNYWTSFLEFGVGGTLADLNQAAEDLSFRFELYMNEKWIAGGNRGPIYRLNLSDDHFSVHRELSGNVEDTQLNFSKAKSKQSNFSSSDDDNSFDLDSIEHVNKSLFEPLNDAAELLRQSFLNRTTGKILSDAFGENGAHLRRIRIVKSDDPFPEEVYFSCGFAGSGKSLSLQSKLKSNFKLKFLVICPRVELKEDWERKVKCSSHKVCTFEVALLQNLSRVELIVIDELGLFPRGYLDLMIFKLRTEKNFKGKVMLLFDPLQARYHSDSDERFLHEIHECDRITSGAKINYLFESWRLSKKFFGNFFVDIELRNSGSVNYELDFFDNHIVAANEAKKRGFPIDLILVASRDEKNSFAGKVNVLTFGEAQGLTVKHSCIVLSEYAEKQDDYRWVVALTRAKEKISFITSHRSGLTGFMSSMIGRPIHAFLTGLPFTSNRMNWMVNCELVECHRATGGRDEVDREDRLEGDPFLKPFVFLGQRINSEEYEIIEPEVIEPKGRVHLCISQENYALARNFDLIRAKEYREAKLMGLETNQFCHDYNRVGAQGSRHVASPLRFESIFPRHRSDDDLTFWMAVKKRLRFSEEFLERAKLKDSYSVGNLLYQNLKEKLSLSFSWDQGLLDECLNDFETKKLLKSKATLANHSIRSDIDWSMDKIFLFMKSQLCTKYEKQYVDAKAGQTLACFSHLVLAKFAPYCRYMEKMLRRNLKEEIYIHSNKNFNDLNDWVVKFFEEGEKVESDYEAFDASQDHYVLAFEVCVMEDMGLPNWFINDYIDLKCTLGCKLGHFAIMRFTGEFSTFLFNTLANMAFTFARYECDHKTPIAFAGDDMCMLKACKVSDKFEDVLSKLSLKAKVIRTEMPMFCGWNLSRYGIVKEPELVFNRFMVAKKRGNIDECLENYAIEVSYAYSLGEKLYEVLKREEQVEYHQAVVRFIVQRLDKLKTKVKDLFSDQNV
ncbi:replicase [Caucasus prunus virus]|uniref:Replicase n=1 Tax=Caucasus prunus virus TaxID=1667230 RepID=A0A0H3YBN9_9VIRU|nr:replicase [Caucasus prunus virus]AKN08994.1 replicase [Caucasus prunus virus]